MSEHRERKRSLLARVAHGWLFSMVGWAAVAPSATVAAARLTRHENRPSVIMVQALTPLLALPVLASFGAAVVTRRRALGLVAGVLVLCHLLWVAPDVRPARPLPEGADGTPRLRLYTANLLFTNTDMSGIAAEIRAARPDVLALQEVSPQNLSRLAAEGVLDEFPHQALAPRPDPFGTAILSRLPLEGAESWFAAEVPMARATVVVGDRRVRLYDVHTRTPFGPGAVERWKNELAALEEVAAEEKEPLVLAGDFNATSGHRSFRRLLGAGLRDAHVERGRWFVTTWPLDLRPLPAFVHIDHVLVSEDVAVLDVREGTGRGSDHRPLVADLALID